MVLLGDNMLLHPIIDALKFLLTLFHVFFFPALQTEDSVKQCIRRLVSSGIFFSHCFSPYYNSGGSRQSRQCCRTEYSARYYFSTSKCESQGLWVNGFQLRAYSVLFSSHMKENHLKIIPRKWLELAYPLNL